ncbi:InlB B-repeat-containing protein [Microbulbifer taiwanensis]|uniref:InlB B-repeat-containing protein n=1 Tax=Microbulbifer taiwanensis TaxID=986746 RepID=UPI001867137B|nr:hypothetical protein [Microbulbifer taiwanensis]
MKAMRNFTILGIVLYLLFSLSACGGSGGHDGEPVEDDPIGNDPGSPPPTEYYSLAASVEGSGSIVSSPKGINCGAVCSADFEASAVITLTATPAAGSRFSHWSKDSCGSHSICEVTLSSHADISAVFAAQPVGGPFLFKTDEARLKASIDADDPEAVGSGSNRGGQPLGFITLIEGAVEDREYYSDIPTFQIAFAGWLSEDTDMLQLAHDEVMSLVSSDPDGDQGHSSNFQHVESRMLMVAATADLAYEQFNEEELELLAGWVNGTLDNWNDANQDYWPFDEPKSNYWQNGILAHVIASVATQDFNPRADEWKQAVHRMANLWIERTTASEWQGPVQSEGHYYSAYVGNAIWALQLFDAAEGTDYLQQSGFDAAEYLDLLMYQTRPHLKHFFEVGSEANASDARHTGLAFRYWHQLIHAAGGDSEQAQHAKSVLQVADSEDATFIGRNVRGFANFYWNIGDFAAAPLDTKADRLFVAPTPGAGLIGLRSTLGFQESACAALMFANNFGTAPEYSHGNPDAPGFQWACGSDWIVTDPEYFNNSGILAEAGSGVLSDVSNIVTLEGQKYNNDGDFPAISHAEDNRGAATPHSYVQIDAQPYWTEADHYVRDYAWLGSELKALVIFDRVDSETEKKWRLHLPVEPQVDGSEVTYTAGGREVRVRDLTQGVNGSDWQKENLADSVTTEDVWRIYESIPGGDYRSVKILDIDAAVQHAELEINGDMYALTLTVNGEDMEIRFHADGSPMELQ